MHAHTTTRRSLFDAPAIAPAPQSAAAEAIVEAAQGYAERNRARGVENDEILNDPIGHLQRTLEQGAATTRETKAITLYNTHDLIQFLLKDTSSKTILFYIPDTIDQTTQESITDMLTKLRIDQEYRANIAQEYELDPDTLAQKISHSSHTFENPNPPLVKAAR